MVNILRHHKIKELEKYMTLKGIQKGKVFFLYTELYPQISISQKDIQPYIFKKANVFNNIEDYVITFPTFISFIRSNELLKIDTNLLETSKKEVNDIDVLTELSKALLESKPFSSTVVFILLEKAYDYFDVDQLKHGDMIEYVVRDGEEEIGRIFQKIEYSYNVKGTQLVKDTYSLYYLDVQS